MLILRSDRLFRKTGCYPDAFQRSFLSFKIKLINEMQGSAAAFSRGGFFIDCEAQIYKYLAIRAGDARRGWIKMRICPQSGRMRKKIIALQLFFIGMC